MQADGKDIELETAKVLATLEPRKDLLLRLKFGLGLSASFSPIEISEQLGIAPDEVAELDAEALRDLKRHRCKDIGVRPKDIGVRPTQLTDMFL